MDKESGGWVLSEMEKNLCHCLYKKSPKIVRFQSKYSKWWLALVDHIGYGLDDLSRQALRNRICLEQPWDKMLIINPLDHRRWFEI